MSLLAATEIPIADKPLAQVSLRPAWLRPLLVAFIVTIHIAALGGFVWFEAEKITPLQEITVEVMPQGETVTETSTVPTPESAPQVAPARPVLAAPDPQMRDDPEIVEPAAPPPSTLPVADLALPPPKTEAPDAPALPIEHPQPQKVEKTKQEIDQRRREEQRKKAKDAKRRAALRALRRAKAEAHARQQAQRA
jgi:periplasmic protein TonB